MELLPPLFNTLQQSKGEINRSNIQLLANPRNAAHRKIWNDNLHWIAAYLSVLSDSPLVFWNDLQRLAINDRHQICFRDLLVWTDYSVITSPHQSSPVLDSHRMPASWADYKRALHSVLGGTPDWKPRQCDSNSLGTVLFLQRIHVRRIENMDELIADAEHRGFSCSELTTDRRTVYVIIQSVIQIRILIGVNSAAYNAIFLPASSAVLEVDAKLGGYYKGSHSSGPQDFLTTHFGYHWLGIHLYLYTVGNRFEKGRDSTIVVPLNVTRRALSDMRHKLEQQEEVGCCEAASVVREECRGTWQLVAKAITVPVTGPDGKPMNLDIPDIHDPASVSHHVMAFCEKFVEMMELGVPPWYIPAESCFGAFIKEVEKQTGQHYQPLPGSACHDTSGVCSTAKVLPTFDSLRSSIACLTNSLPTYSLDGRIDTCMRTRIRARTHAHAHACMRFRTCRHRSLPTLKRDLRR